uniref:Uncharacterized protein n=1 Tax=Ananas comosus var. bracteatus TaxID=296719 RepID=A0A6V7Q1U4_ANACO|nr:unnamed protein product [Ananas comosus var. bracteatus]
MAKGKEIACKGEEKGHVRALDRLAEKKTGKKIGDIACYTQWREVTGSRRLHDSSTSSASLTLTASYKKNGVNEGRKNGVNEGKKTLTVLTRTASDKKNGVNEGWKLTGVNEGRKKIGVNKGTYLGKPRSEVGAALTRRRLGLMRRG